jgi:hypothetical protein
MTVNKSNTNQSVGTPKQQLDYLYPVIQHDDVQLNHLCNILQ